MTPQNSSHANEGSHGGGGIQIKDDHFNALRNSPTDLIYNNESNASPKSPTTHTDKSPRGLNQTGSHEQLSKRSSSNLDTIVEQHVQHHQPIVYRQSSKTQPIPMKNTGFPMNQAAPSAASLQLQRYSNDLTQLNDESSADEYNSSSVASTPDTIYTLN
jgi:hypothetical protein